VPRARPDRTLAAAPRAVRGNGKAAGEAPDRAEVEKRQRERTFNGLTAREWTVLGRNVWSDVSSPRDPHHLEHGAVYPVKLVERLVTMYSKRGDRVLDPFVGVGSTAIGALNLGRHAVGIELSPKFVKVARRWVKETQDLFTGAEAKIRQGDCRTVLKSLPDDHFQLLVTSPPYADFIRRSVDDRAKTHKTSIIRHENNSRVRAYSDSAKDFGNLPYDRFLEHLEPVLAECFRVLEPGGYQVWVVKDHRDTRAGVPYIAFHADLAQLAKGVGLTLHDLIVWDQNEQRRLVLLGYPSVFYTNQNCSFLVVLRKPPE
jgi:DNA modification methylase